MGSSTDLKLDMKKALGSKSRLAKTFALLS
jgi:hypothetical protein